MIRPALLVALGLLLVLAGGCSKPEAFSARNLLLVSVDTLRWDRLGCYGDPDARTPGWDRVARQGSQFRTMIQPQPFTLPSHVTMLTGHHPMQHRVRANDARAVDPPGRTLAETVSMAGLATGGFASSIVLDGERGFARGFDVYSWQDERGQPERPASHVVAEALAWLDAVPADEPYFLFTHFYDAHDPYEPPSPWDRSEADPYRGEVAAVDRQLVSLLRGLDTRDRTHRTLVILTSDHGEAFGEHDETGHGLFVYDTTIRVPLTLWGPFPYRGNTIRPDLARGIDVTPTALEGLRIGPDWRLPGRQLARRLKPHKEAKLDAYAETFWAARNLEASDLRTYQKNGWKYIRAPREELYDLRRDPGERNNLFDSEPVLADSLRDLLLDLLEDDLEAPAGLVEEHALDPARAEELAALGYTGGDAGRSVPWGNLDAVRDPKSLTGLAELLDRALPVAERGDWDRARPLLEEVLAKDPRNVDALRALAREQFEAGRPDAGLALWRDAAEAAPTSAPVWTRYALESLRYGDAAPAREVLRRAVSLSPNDVDLRIAAATAALRTGAFEEAAQEAAIATRLAPDSRRARQLVRQIEESAAR